GRRFSVLTFGIAQVSMDIEPLVGLVRGSSVLHGSSHTYLAALVIAIVVAVVSPPICRPILRRWNRELSFYRLGWLVEAESFAPLPVIAGAFVGTISHVMLDSIMHSDISPLAPWSDANALLGLISIGALHQFCILAGLFGVVGWFFVAWRKQRAVVSHEG
ncbi:MAG: DUF4184 family protein, partial [Actinomycetota bacterium]|nr:DUF4184 family protein [Actinomycetota bacterium]